MRRRGTSLTALACTLALGVVGAIGWRALGSDLPAGVGADPALAGEARATSAVAPELVGAGARRSGPARGCRVSGVVLGPEGALAARVRVSRRAAPRGTSDAQWGGAGALHAALEAPPTRRHASVETASGTDGAFALEGLAPGGWLVEAEAEGLAGGVGVTLDAAGQHERVTLRLAKADQRLRGRARWADGLPFVGTVRVANFEGSVPAPAGGARCVCRAVATGADGAFDLGGLSRGWLCLTAFLDGTWRARGQWVLLPAEAPVEYVVDGAGERALGVVVSEATGAAVEGATVHLLRRGDGGHEQSAVLRTGPDGTFGCPWGRGWTSQVVVEAPGYARRDWGWVHVSEPCTFGLRREAVLVGCVRDDAGQPVSGVRLRLLGCPLAGSVVADAEGRYRFDGLPEGEVVLTTDVGQTWVPRRAYGSLTSSNDRAENYDSNAVDLRAGETASLDLVLEVGAVLEGRVVDAADWPVAGQAVWLDSRADDRAPARGWEAPPSAVSDAQGAFTLTGLVRGAAYSVRALDLSGNGVEVEGTAHAPADEAATPVRLVLPRTSLWRVEVVDERSGAPVADAEVGASTSGKDGVALVGPLRASGTRVRVAAPGYVERSDVTLTASEGPGRAKVSLCPERRLAIRLRLPDGSAPATSYVLLASTDAERAWRSEWMQADASGSVRASVPAGSALSAEGYAKSAGVVYRADVEVAADAESLEIALAAAPPEVREGRAASGGGLRVRVLDPDGRPVPSVQVRAAPGSLGQTRRDGDALCFEQAASQETELDVYDARDAQGLPLGLAPVHLGPLGDVGAELVVRLERERTLAGTVRGPDGAPVAGVAVRAVPERVDDGRPQGALPVEHGRARTDAAGRFVLRGLADEPYVLRFAPPRHLCAPRRVLAAPGGAAVEVRLRAAVEALVRVVDERGQVLPGSRVWAVRSVSGGRGGGGGDVVAQGFAGAEGTVSLGNLDPGASYELCVDPARPGASEGAAGDDAADVAEADGFGDDTTQRRSGWRPADVTVTVDALEALSGSVLDERGERAAGATVLWTPGDGSWGSTSADGLGRFRLLVPLGARITLAAEEGGASAPGAAARRVRAHAGARGVVVPLVRGATLRVRVDGEDPPDPAALPTFQDEWGWFLLDTGPRRRARLVPEGEGAASLPALEGESSAGFEFRGVAAGAPYTLWIWGGNDGRVACVRGVRAGGADLEVETVPGSAVRGTVLRPGEVTSLWVEAVGGPAGASVRGRVEPDGRYRIEGLLPGTWCVRAGGEDEEREWEAGAEVEAGARADLRLSPR